MPITVKHSKVSTIPDDADTSLVRPSDWNADHTLVGLGTMAEQNANAVAITGGTINGTTIGATTPSTVNATTITGQTGVLRGTGQNFIIRSTDLTNAAWTSVNLGSVTGGQADPFGGTTAALINEGTATNFHYLSINPSVSSNTYTLSVYAKAGTSNFIGIFATVINQGAIFNLTTGAFTGNYIGAPVSYTSTNTGLPAGWWRVSIVVTGAFGVGIATSSNGTATSYTGTSQTVTVAAPQLEIGSTLNTYIPTTTTAVYGTPTLSFSGVSEIGLLSTGALYLQPAGTGALQAQATTSTTAGGNARGANAVDWQTLRGAASQVAGSSYSTIAGGQRNTAGTGAFVGGGYQNNCTAYESVIVGGSSNTSNNFQSFTGAGSSNTNNGTLSVIVGGSGNTSNGYYNFIGGGFTNSGTSATAVTTQSGTMNGTTAVTLSGSNANIKVGQLITGTSISFPNTYVAAISGTSLTLSQNASGSSTSTLTFYTPHGVVVGGGNNQATGSYSFIGGGGDAGTAANRNVASGDWSFVGGGRKNTASGAGSVVSGGGTDGTNTFANLASGITAFIGGGWNNTAGGQLSTIAGGTSNNSSAGSSFIGGGDNHAASGGNSAIMGGRRGTTRSITGYHAFPACFDPLGSTAGASQAALLVLAIQTTDATATALSSANSAAGSTNQVILPNNSAYFFTGEVISGVTGGGNTKGWTIEGVIKRGANAASTALVGTPTVTSTYADAGAATWAIAVTADTTNGGLRVTFTGQAATTIRTVCQIRTTEMTF